MLLKNALIKIKKSFGRYLSMFIIVMVGVGFYAGIQATTPHMLETANDYFVDSSLMDFKVISTMGLTKDDADVLSGIKGATSATGSYSLDVLASDKALRVHAIEDSVNKLQLITGRYPTSMRECVADDMNYKVGDEIKITSSTKNKLKYKIYTVVGTVQSSLYLYNDYGSTSIGDGNLSSFFFIQKNSFEFDAFTEIYVTIEKTDLMAYSAEYEAKASQYNDKLSDIKPLREEARYQEIYQAANNKIRKSQRKLNKSEAKGEQKLMQAKGDLDNGRRELLDGKRQLAGNESALNSRVRDQRADFQAAKNKMKEGRNQIKKALKQYNLKESQIDGTVVRMAAQIKEMKKTLKQLPKESHEYKTLYSSLQQLQTQYDGLKQLKSSIRMMTYQENRLSNGIKTFDREIANARREIKSAKATMASNGVKLNDGYKKWRINKNEFISKIADAQDKIDGARKELSKIDHPKWHVFDRDMVAGYTGLKSGIDLVASAASILPLFFILIVALIASNSMSRMIAEERSELGTFTSLGYRDRKIISTYMFYILSSSVLGGLAGYLAGCTVIPPLIYDKFEFAMPPLKIHYNLMTIVWIMVITATLMSVVTFMACRRELKHEPAYLMRPLPPSRGQRILLQRIGFIWNHLSFTWKVTMRNLFRYKKRALMTIVGIASCTAFLIVGFGLRDSMNGVADKQYEEVMKYTLQIILKDEVKSIRGNLQDLASAEGIDDPLCIKQASYKYQYQEEARDALLIVPEDESLFTSYFHLIDAKTNETAPLESGGIIITEKMAEFLKVHKGDKIELKDTDNNLFNMKVSSIVKNYTSNYVYMSKATYTKLLGKPPLFNAVVSGHHGDESLLARRLIDNDSVINVIFKDTILEKAEKNNGRLNSIVVLIIVVSSLLALIVLYNLTSINISERTREIATLKVLGFYDRETNAYIYREAFLLSLISIFAGIFLGIALHGLVVSLIEGDIIVFVRKIHWLSFIWSCLITLAFSVIMQIFTYLKLKQIDMIDSLKAVE